MLEAFQNADHDGDGRLSDDFEIGAMLFELVTPHTDRVE